MDDEQAAPMGQGTPVNDAKGGGLGRITGGFIDEGLCWGDLEWLRRCWAGKVVVKGVMCVEDVREAVRWGCDGVVLRYFGFFFWFPGSCSFALLSCQNA